MNEFVKERNAALLSLDEDKIRDYAKKYGIYMSDNMEIFWRAVHKARTGITSLPKEERIRSKQWLNKRGSESWDDGELEQPPTATAKDIIKFCDRCGARRLE